jgi:tetratricopeptide (TPR) repeat protein
MRASLPEKVSPDFNTPVSAENGILMDDPTDLSNDPVFLNLLDHYQLAEFEKCVELLSALELKYPNHPRLQKFKDDLQMKLSLKTITVSSKKEHKDKQVKMTFRMGVFAIVSAVLIMLVFFVSYLRNNSSAKTQQADLVNAQITSLNNQAEQLLLAGQPQPAKEIVQRIQSMNPDYVNLPNLISSTDDLLRLETKYQSATDLVAEKKTSEALVILKEIEAEKPGMWDVSQQITSLETSLQIAKYLDEGNDAYQKENWDKVISSYENVLTLSPKSDDPMMKEQLFMGYLNKIISMLQSEGTSIEDIEHAEQYYRRAVSLIPQSKAYSSERVNLQEVSSDLLVLKYTQTAKAILKDKNQIRSSIDTAVSYLRKATNIKPKNTALKSDLVNAEYYQMGFQSFIDMDWIQAIYNLSAIVSVDPNYADGNANQLLYEAYYALGKQYYAISLYQDARKNLEQAEILAWGDSKNSMKLFQVQILLGDTFAKTGDFKNAVSYYKYSLDAIQANLLFEPYSILRKDLISAEYLVQLENYKDAVPVFQDLLKGIPLIYKVTEVEIGDGLCLAFFASENLSTVDAIIEANNLSKSMVITFSRILKVPSISK